MGVLADHQIIDLCENHAMITPFERKSVKSLQSPVTGEHGDTMSWGASSYGYDIRLSSKELKMFKNEPDREIDPRRMTADCYYDPEIKFCEDGMPYVLMPPNSGLLGHTPEYFKMPRDVLCICTSKSTYARAFLSVLVTPLEPSWEGNLVVEIVNHTGSSARVYLDCGIAQLFFLRAESECKTSYADRGGKYQKQVGTQDAIV